MGIQQVPYEAKTPLSMACTVKDLLYKQGRAGLTYLFTAGLIGQPLQMVVAVDLQGEEIGMSGDLQARRRSIL